MIWIKKGKAFYFIAFLAPALFFYTLFFILPLGKTMQLAFSAWDGTGKTQWTGLQNVRELFNPGRENNFLPRNRIIPLFRKEYELPYSLSPSAYTKLIDKEIREPGERALLEQAYSRQTKNKYILSDPFNEFILYKNIGMLGKEAPAALSPVLEALQQAAFQHLDPAFILADAAGACEAPAKAQVDKLLQQYYKIFVLKRILSTHLYAHIFAPGVMGFTLFFTLVNLVLANLAALLLALGLMKSRCLYKYMAPVFLLPRAFSLICVAYLWTLLFDKFLPGLRVLELWITTPRLTPLLIAFAGAWRNCSVLVLIYIAGLKLIPREYRDAAELSGASRGQKFFKITAPLLRPAFSASIFWSMISSLKVFELCFSLAGTSGYATNITPLTLDIYITAFTGNRWGFASAKALLLGLIVAGFSGLLLWILKKQKGKL